MGLDLPCKWQRVLDRNGKTVTKSVIMGERRLKEEKCNKNLERCLECTVISFLFFFKFLCATLLYVVSGVLLKALQEVFLGWEAVERLLAFKCIKVRLAVSSDFTDFLLS